MGKEIFTIDTILLSKFLNSNHGLDQDVTAALINWNGSLQLDEPAATRAYAKKFLSKLASVSLKDLNLPEEKQKILIEIFDPLEEIFRLALSLSDNNLRDHLSHTIRNFLFSHYILNNYKTPAIQKDIKKLTVSSIFHDIAYPIEKFKKGTKALTDKLFLQFLDSESNFDLELSNPSNLLEILSVIGSKEHDVFSYLYKNVIAPSIAGQGLFDAPRCLSSVVLFLRPIIMEWGENGNYWKTKNDEISDICLTMAFHDRKMYPPRKIKQKTLPRMTKALRIADELQEWGRDNVKSSFVEGVELIEDGPADVFLHMNFKMKDQECENGKPCDPVLTITDKIIGLLPISDSEKIILSFDLPRKTPNDFQEQLKKAISAYKFYNKRHSASSPDFSIKFTTPKKCGEMIKIKLNKGLAEITLS